MRMSEEYLKAMHLSYVNQEGGITVPAEALNQIVEIPFGGSQPLGICGRRIAGGDEIFIASYFEPAICSAKVTRDEAGLQFKVSWIRSVDYGKKSIRIFPNVFRAGGANRLQTVNTDEFGNLWVSRNGERKFFVFSPPVVEGGRWQFTGKVMCLPRSNSRREYSFVHSALLAGPYLYTIEGAVGENWKLLHYVVEKTEIVRADLSWPVGEYRYGIGMRPSDSGFWTVTDVRSKEPHGIYRDGELRIPGVEGNGIYFLQDGSALVTRYGQSYPGCFNGIPGALIYVPSRLF